VGSLQDLLTTSTYCGKNYFNQTDTRNEKKRPPSEWIEMGVPAIIDEATFNRTKLTLRNRSPRQTPPRVVNGPAMLAGVARCAQRGPAMMQNTGRRGLYRHYCCSRKMKQGATACPGQRIRMDELDKMVLDYLSSQLFNPVRLELLLASFLSEASQDAQARKEKLRQTRDARGALDARQSRLLALVEQDVMQPDDPALAERMDKIRFQKAKLDREIGRLQDSLKLGIPTLTPDKRKTCQSPCASALPTDRPCCGKPICNSSWSR
jgi:hypothetical protein